MAMSRSEAASKASRSRTPESRRAAGIKAAQTRGHQSLSEAGRKGGQNSHRGKQTTKRDRDDD